MLRIGVYIHGYSRNWHRSVGTCVKHKDFRHRSLRNHVKHEEFRHDNRHNRKTDTGMLRIDVHMHRSAKKC